jgi:peptide/nickel transport system ATP-binding protein/oligopeptide transport system ATP-binding protein
VFCNRCPYADATCRRAVPPLVETSPGHLVRCVRPGVAAVELPAAPAGTVAPPSGRYAP